ncbi:HPr family phosphocarrier protein [Desulfovibrio sp. OttesenSCG-928-G15]|nr:HPr family phosphocarrier protein [Desulfovibrio sp. OttesenSCG-928-G15]
MEEPQVERTIVIANELGLHARPAGKLAQAAQQFSAEVQLEYDDMTVDAKSILDILTLAAGRGANLTLRCAGKDAEQAAESIADFFTRLAAGNE